MSEHQHRPEESTTDQPHLEGEYDAAPVESRWQQTWVEDGTYEYEPVTDPNTAYAIDTPPPTVSGSLHMGHLYGNTLQDFTARFNRMYREETFFPFGYDDNGIASERLTERELGVSHTAFSRREFQSKCRTVCQSYETEFTDQMQALGVSIDWSNTYKTIEPRVQRLSQLSFLDLLERDREYRRKAPTIWCPDCETAISQVETEDADRASHENDIAFELVEPGSESPAPEATAESERAYPVPREPGDDIVITTTRPELIPACVAMFVHPDDEATAHLAGGTAAVPLFGHEVPIYADDRIDRETGTGIAMCCTFGDQTDIEWYQAHDLDLRIAIDESATMTDLAGEYAGLHTTETRTAIVEDLADAGRLRDREAITHTVQVHERCEVDVEFRVSEQWYVRLLDKTEEYLAAGEQMDWNPEKMFTRYEHWIEGLEWDWCISRQRDSGIPFPVWYCADCGETILADRGELPVEPIEDDPSVDRCPACGHDEFEPEQDVFDTWATSSLTPLINAGWDWYPDRTAVPAGHTVVNESAGGVFAMERTELYPLDMRPQGQDIISFWLFHTVVKCYEHTGQVPFEDVMIHGMVLDENRKAMSKSKGNVVEPAAIMDEYPIDAIRYWAASASLGDDFPFKTNELIQGEKLLQKLWNASKLVDQLAPAAPESVSHKPTSLKPVDRWILAELDDVIADVTEQFRTHEYLKARTRLREFFWHTFCDDYLEIAKQRVDEHETASTEYALTTAHRTILKLFAPLVPHITEEIWRAQYGDESVHRADWPTPGGYNADRSTGQTAMAVVSALRRYKTDAGLALNTPLDHVEVYGRLDGFTEAVADVMHVDELTVHDETPAIETTVRGIELDYAQVGPEYGERVNAIEDAIAAEEFELVDDQLRAAGVELAAEMFTIRTERAYSGAGELLETDDTAVIVHQSGSA
jgi:valyl-tRNA synthetase (EC 6.1.1.9)